MLFNIIFSHSYRSESLWTQMRVSWAELLSGGFWKESTCRLIQLVDKVQFFESAGLKAPFPWQLPSRGCSQLPEVILESFSTWPFHLNPSSNNMLNPSCISNLWLPLLPAILGTFKWPMWLESLPLAIQHKIIRVTPGSKGHESHLKCQAIFLVWGIRFWKVFRKQINLNLGKERRVNILKYKVDFMEWWNVLKL